MPFEIIDSIEDAVEIYAMSIRQDSILREPIHERLCELLDVDIEEFKPFDDVGITKTPTKEEAEQILWDAINELTGRRTLEEEPTETELYIFRTIMIVLLSSWIILTIFILINIQELSHLEPSSDQGYIWAALCLSFWLFITMIISIGLLASFSKLWVKKEHHKHSKIL